MNELTNDTVVRLIPVYNPEVPLASRDMRGEDLKNMYSENILMSCLNDEKTLVYKGNEYYLDLA